MNVPKCEYFISNYEIPPFTGTKAAHLFAQDNLERDSYLQVR